MLENSDSERRHMSSQSESCIEAVFPLVSVVLFAFEANSLQMTSKADCKVLYFPSKQSSLFGCGSCVSWLDRVDWYTRIHQHTDSPAGESSLGDPNRSSRKPNYRPVTSKWSGAFIGGDYSTPFAV